MSNCDTANVRKLFSPEILDVGYNFTFPQGEANKFDEVMSSSRVKFNILELIETGDECYRCTECARNSKVFLCSACFEASIHTEHTYEVIKVGRGGTVRCHCGLRDSWLPTVSEELITVLN